MNETKTIGLTNVVDPDKSLVDNETVNDGLSDQVQDVITKPPKDNKNQTASHELLDFTNVKTERTVIKPELEYNKILENIVKRYKKDFKPTNKGTYGYKLKSGAILEFDGFQLPTINGEYISSYLTDPTDKLENDLREFI